MAQVKISGTSVAVVADSLAVSILRSDGQSWRTAYAINSFVNDSFDLAFDIDAMLENYLFTVELIDGSGPTLVDTAGNVVAGDVYAIQGQSNAQAAAYNGDANIWQNNYIRTFGNPDPNGYGDQNWYIAEGNGFYTAGTVGQWGLKLGYELQSNTGIPVAIINAADPGQPIEHFQRNDTLINDSSTNYGRLFRRSVNAKVKNKIRGIFFYQGESDGSRATIHKSLFEEMYYDWVSDYLGLEVVYVVQVREGCGSPTLELRDNQRLFATYLPMVKCMTANGLPGHDGCHYALPGYEKLGLKISKQLLNDLYSIPLTEQLNINVLDAQFINADNTKILLTTDADSLIAQIGSAGDFKLNGSASIILGISIDSNQVILDVDPPVFETNVGISYNGHAGDNTGWVMNADSNGMYTFYNLPITNQTPIPTYDIPAIMSGPGNCLNFDGVDDGIYVGPVLGTSYTKEAWVYWTGGSTTNNIISGNVNTAFWIPDFGNGHYLCSGHNSYWNLVADTAPFIPYKWTHVAVTYDEALQEMKLYKNGNLVSTAQGVTAHNDPEVFISAYAWYYGFAGKIDEVKIWDTVRSMEDIRATMCHKISGTEPGLTSYFRFDQTSGGYATNETPGQPDGWLFYFQTPEWQRSGAPIGTISSYVYQDTSDFSLVTASGDSLVLSNLVIPDFLHLYFTEEVPNVLQPAPGNLLVDYSKFFGLFYPGQSIDTFTLSYHYTGNSFALVDEQHMSILHRRNFAQPYWENSDSVFLDYSSNFISTEGNKHQEYILAIYQDSLVGISNNLHSSPVFAYPNPAFQTLYLKGTSIQKLTLMDINGRICFEQENPGTSVSLSELPTGMYFAEIIDRELGIFRQKIVVQKN